MFPRTILLCAAVVLGLSSNLPGQSLTGTLLDRNGEVLRGTPLVISGNNEVRDAANAFATDPSTLLELKSRGLNTVRLCLVDPYFQSQTSYSHWTIEQQLPHIDAVIQNATAVGMNVVLNYHSVGEFDGKKRPDFSLASAYWEILAPRYAENELVCYELVNEPTFHSDTYLDRKFKSQLIKLYQRVRELAPQRQILMFSFSSLDHDIEAIVQDYSSQMDWEYTSVAWHAYGADETSLSRISEMMNHYRMVCTEWNYPMTFPYVPDELDGYRVHAGALENVGCGWMDWRDWDEAGTENFDAILVPDAMLRGYEWLPTEDPSEPGEDSTDEVGGPDESDVPDESDMPGDGGEGTDPPMDVLRIVHVEEISLELIQRGRVLRGAAAIKVVDDNGNAAVDALVTVSWSTPFGSEMVGMTNSEGVVEFETTSRIDRGASGTAVLTVVNVEHVDGIYDDSQNRSSSDWLDY